MTVAFAVLSVVLLPWLFAGLDGLIEIATDRDKRRGLTDQWFGWAAPGMAPAWARIRARPWSWRHEWINLLTRYYEVPYQERSAKFTGLVVLVTWMIGLAAVFVK